MKAVDYYEKYGQWLWEECQNAETKTDGAFAKLYIEFMQELNSIVTSRHIMSKRACMSAIDEQNRKWNALIPLFVKRYGESPIARDGFKKACLKDLCIEVNEHD